MIGFELSRRAFVSGLASSAAVRVLPGGSAGFVFAYFRDDDQVDQTSGLHLAISRDGTRFEPVRGGGSVLRPMVGEERVLRDPCLFRGQGADAPYHLVWTTGWQGTTLGHATSRDLLDWSPQQAIPVMQDFAGTRNVWAPEGIWDPVRRLFVLFWSSTVPGRFGAGKTEARNHRFFYTTTRDFRSFAPSRLLFDPGFNIIDATFLRDRKGGLHLVLKDERLDPLEKSLRIASAASPTGPFGPLSDPLTEHWVEGPAALWLGDRYRIYFDAYRDKRFGAIDSVDLKNWTPVSGLVMPVGARHGTVLPISASLMSRLEGAR